MRRLTLCVAAQGLGLIASQLGPRLVLLLLLHLSPFRKQTQADPAAPPEYRESVDCVIEVRVYVICKSIFCSPCFPSLPQAPAHQRLRPLPTTLVDLTP
jgi:hypothetical protein